MCPSKTFKVFAGHKGRSRVAWVQLGSQEDAWELGDASSEEGSVLAFKGRPSSCHGLGQA